MKAPQRPSRGFQVSTHLFICKPFLSPSLWKEFIRDLSYKVTCRSSLVLRVCELLVASQVSLLSESPLAIIALKCLFLQMAAHVVVEFEQVLVNAGAQVVGLGTHIPTLYQPMVWLIPKWLLQIVKHEVLI